jgi:hypothetical protein
MWDGMGYTLQGLLNSPTIDDLRLGSFPRVLIVLREV